MAETLSLVSLLYYTGITLLTLFLPICIHEFGHYIIARRSGVHTESISIFFSVKKPLYQKSISILGQKTTLNIGYIPFGGYVAFPRDALHRISPWKSIGIYLAGPLANITFGVCTLLVIHLAYMDWNPVASTSYTMEKLTTFTTATTHFFTDPSLNKLAGPVGIGNTATKIVWNIPSWFEYTAWISIALGLFNLLLLDGLGIILSLCRYIQKSLFTPFLIERIESGYTGFIIALVMIVTANDLGLLNNPLWSALFWIVFVALCLIVTALILVSTKEQIKFNQNTAYQS
ncbi:MAG: site-2 protease family protein [Alphaproteobacteria bacterium]|nr:site-2 protease family protein [Alphaproteobacteria bacterium]